MSTLFFFVVNVKCEIYNNFEQFHLFSNKFNCYFSFKLIFFLICKFESNKILTQSNENPNIFSFNI